VARALVTGPDLVVMDDVTAALDAENEEALWDAVERRHPDLTAVVVTHRVATAMRADTIVVLDRGRVVDRGTHEELLGRCGLYRRLAGRDLHP
jgi:ATP-binding cassette subfamily B protein